MRPARLLSLTLPIVFSLLLCFGLGQLAPGDAFTALELDPSVPAATLAHWRAIYLPQQSWGHRFAAWLWAAAHGDLGYSLQFHRSVTSLLAERTPASLELIILGLGMAWGGGLLLVLIPAWMGESARRRLERWLQLGLHGLASLLTALPLGVLAIGALLFAPLSWLPGAGAPSVLLPAGILALAFLPTVYFQADHALGRVRNLPFLDQSRAAGFGPARLLLGHALPNTSDALVPIAALSVSQALVELVILEPLLGWPGLGQLSIQAAQSKDMPVLAGLVLMTSLVVALTNWGSEGAQALLNPQLRQGRRFVAARAA